MSCYWSGKNGGNPVLIRYMGCDLILSGNTGSIIDGVVTARFGHPAPDLDWPGLVFDIESDVAKALLATPHSLGVAWMMTDHAAILGRRHHNSHSFMGKFTTACML